MRLPSAVNLPVRSRAILRYNVAPRIRSGTCRRKRALELTTANNNTTLTVVKSVCPLDCPDTCSMLVTVKDGVAVDVHGDPDHRFTRGFPCQKMARYLERVYSPDRLIQPMRRTGRKGQGRFEPVTWN